jgi:hypothetical protein
MSSLLGRLVGTLALVAPLVTVAAPARATEEIVRMETRVVDCQDMLPGSLGCQQYVHTYTTTNANETRAGKTFVVYTKAEIDERLNKPRVSADDPVIQALAAEIAELRRSIAEASAVCAETPRAAAARD